MTMSKEERSFFVDNEYLTDLDPFQTRSLFERVLDMPQSFFFCAKPLLLTECIAMYRRWDHSISKDSDVRTRCRGPRGVDATVA